MVDELGKSHGVIVNMFTTDDTASCVQATLSGNQSGIIQVEKELLSLERQLQAALKIQYMDCNCMFVPLFLSANVASVLTEVENSQHIDISIVEHTGAHLSVKEFSQRLRQQDPGQLLSVTNLAQFGIPNVPIYVNFTWKVKDNRGQVMVLDTALNQHLNEFYYSSKDKATIDLNGNQCVVDVSSLELTNVSSGETFILIKEPQQPTWSYAIEANQFIKHEASDSKALEYLYRYGGSFVTLAGNKHTLDLSKMHQVDLETGERVAVKRHPVMAQGVVPEYSITIAVRGLSDELSTTMKAVQEKLRSFLSSVTVTSDFMSTVPQDWQEIILIQLLNTARQYCLRIGSFGVESGKLKIQLKGTKDVLDKVQIQLKEQCLELQHHVISHALLQQSQAAADIDRYPPEWEAQEEDIELFEVQEGSSEWKGVKSLMKQTIPKVSIHRIERVQNQKLWDKYALEMKHMSERNGGTVNEKFLFHGTRNTSPGTILISVRGIDFRYSRRDYQLLWGTGAYFAVNASYSDNYCYIDQTHNVKQLLLVKVLTGNSCSYGRTNDSSLTKPPPLSQGSHLLYDTVNGFTNGSCVYVVYDHDRAYPAYLISYRC